MMNNYERIKAMTIDEMAKIFNQKFCEECCYSSWDEVESCNPQCWANPQNEYYLKWLKKEEE